MEPQDDPLSASWCLNMTIARYAVLLKLHYWDDFAERRLQHLLRKVTTGDVYIFVDETNGAVGHIGYDHVVRATERDMLELETLLYPEGKVFWYNVDYPLYFFFKRNRSYSYYLMCEHDTVLNIDIDEFVRNAEQGGVDYVGFPLEHRAWPLQTCEGVYPESFTLHNWLNCISLHSKRSVEFLLERRQALARRYNAGEITNWPNNEAFIPTEMLNNGFVVRKLSDFGKVDKYNWWPPSHENDLPLLEDQAFLHPVLDERRYVASCIQQADLRSYFLPGSQLRQLLSRTYSASSVPAFLMELARRTTPKIVLDCLRRYRRAIYQMGRH